MGPCSRAYLLVFIAILLRLDPARVRIDPTARSGLEVSCCRDRPGNLLSRRMKLAFPAFFGG